jgi:hypothetical protein
VVVRANTAGTGAGAPQREGEGVGNYERFMETTGALSQEWASFWDWLFAIGKDPDELSRGALEIAWEVFNAEVDRWQKERGEWGEEINWFAFFEDMESQTR